MILTKLLTIKGKDVVSAIKPLAIINGNMARLLKPIFLPLLIQWALRLKLRHHLRKNAATTAPNNMI